MKRIFLVLIYGLLILSCTKESDDLLTKGTWILNTGVTSTMKESVVFKLDRTYFVESRVSIPRFNDYISVSISGDWMRQDNKIIFLNSMVHFPNDTSSLNILQTTSGVPLGAFYGYLVTGIYQNDSSLIDDSGSIQFDNLNGSGIFLGEDSNQRCWTIVKLTADSLIVDSKGKLLNYYSE